MRKLFSNIKKELGIFFIKKLVYWYQKLKFLISQNNLFFLYQQFDFFLYQKIIFRYHNFEFFISDNDFLYQEMICIFRKSIFLKTEHKTHIKLRSD